MWVFWWEKRRNGEQREERKQGKDIYLQKKKSS
jgi:hypothetical protein